MRVRRQFVDRLLLWRDESENALAGRRINIDTNALEGLDRLGPGE